MNFIFVTILFLAPVLAGLSYFLVKPSQITKNFKVMLTFAGAFLFSITIIHLIPELFEMAHEQLEAAGGAHQHGSMMIIGVYVLLGFFLQKGLEFFSSGVEHGHIHHHHGLSYSPVMLLASLCVHSFMEGTILNHAPQHLDSHQPYDLLLGVVFHHAPAAFILMMILASQYKKKITTIGMLFLFALSSPLGMWVGSFLIAHGKEQAYLIMYALVTGNFLHISTTIFIESSPEHKIEKRKIVAILLGVGMAFFTVMFH